MSQNNQERIQQINELIVKLDNQRIAGGISLQTIEEIGHKIKKLEDERAVLESAMQAEAHEVIQNDHVNRVSSVATQVDAFLENMDFGGMTLRQVIGGEKEYQLVSIEFKKTCIALVEPSSTLLAEQQALHSEQARGFQERETQLQRQNEILQTKINKQSADLEESNRLLSQEKLERASAEKTRENAVAQLDEAYKEIAQHKSHIDDLRNEIALGTRGAIALVDTAEEEAQKKELAEQIRKERTIYDVQWVDDIKRNKKRAKLAATGEEIEFPWTVEGKYFVIDEAQVSQFREQYAIAVAPEVPNVAETPVQAPEPVAGNQFPTTRIAVPALGSGQVQGYPVNVELSETATEEYITRSEFERGQANLKAEILAEIRGAA